MGLLSFLSRKPSAAAPPSGDAVEQARTRARRRLIGAVVLVGIGVIGFPLLFETAPRPIPVDVPIEIPRKDSVPPLALPPLALPPPAAGRGATGVVEAPREPVVEAAAAPPTVAASAPLPPPKAIEPDRPAAKPAPDKTAAADKAERATATVAKAPATVAKAPATAATAATGRLVIQVGAYADAKVARDVRQRVEKLGLKTFTQVVETDAGQRTRVRVGPFADRGEADEAASRLRSAGLPAALMGQ